MSGVNKAIIVGNLGKDPESRQSAAGNQIVTMSVATGESWRDKTTGERKEKTEWHRVVIFNENLCKTAMSYLKKGSKVYLEGKMQTRKWTDQQGVDRYTTEVVLSLFGATLVLLGGQASGGGFVPPNEDHPDDADQDGLVEQAAMSGDLDDEIPF